MVVLATRDRSCTERRWSSGSCGRCWVRWLGLQIGVLSQREPDLDITGITTAQFLAGGLPLISLVIA
jgi:hypothetical protein